LNVEPFATRISAACCPIFGFGSVASRLAECWLSYLPHHRLLQQRRLSRAVDVRPRPLTAACWSSRRLLPPRTPLVPAAAHARCRRLYDLGKSRCFASPTASMDYLRVTPSDVYLASWRWCRPAQPCQLARTMAIRQTVVMSLWVLC